MKKTMITTALLAGLIGAAGTAFAADNVRPVQCPPPGAAGPVHGPGYDRGPDAGPGGPVMKNMLGLSDRQGAKIAELKQGFFRDSKPVMDRLRSLKHDLAVESVRNRPDKRKITGLTKSIGQAHVRLAELESRHLRDLASVLDSNQLDMLMRIKDNPHGRHFKRG